MNKTDPGAAAALTARLRMARIGLVERRLTAQEVGDFAAERVDAVFEALIEHVANHDHAALRPLTHASGIRVIERSGEKPIPANDFAKTHVSAMVSPNFAAKRSIWAPRPAAGSTTKTAAAGL
jgi:hypothetical protein